MPAKIISERLGHSTAAFTLQTYTHVIPGMDEQAARSVASLILGPRAQLPNPDGRILGGQPEDEGPTQDADPGESPSQRW